MLASKCHWHVHISSPHDSMLHLFVVTTCLRYVTAVPCYSIVHFLAVLSGSVSFGQSTALVWLRTQSTSVRDRQEWVPDHDATSSLATAVEASRSTDRFIAHLWILYISCWHVKHLSHPYQLSLAILHGYQQWVSGHVNGHTVQCTSPVSLILQCKCLT